VVREEPALDSAPHPAHDPSLRRPPRPLKKRAGSRTASPPGLACANSTTALSGPHPTLGGGSATPAKPSTRTPRQSPTQETPGKRPRKLWCAAPLVRRATRHVTSCATRELHVKHHLRIEARRLPSRAAEAPPRADLRAVSQAGEGCAPAVAVSAPAKLS
jgi:hypothetical protein